MQFRMAAGQRQQLAAMALLCSVVSGTAFAQTAQHYKQTNLTSNQASLAPVADQNLVNPWGLSRSSGGPWWVSDNGTGLSTLYTGTGAIVPLVVKIPAADPTATGSPTGTIFNGGTGFVVGGKAAANGQPAVPGLPAVFLFVTEDGTVSGWNPKVNATNAVIAVNEKNHSVYKGATAATANVGGQAQQLLYVADFFHGKVQVFDSSFNHVSAFEGRFSQRHNEGEREEEEQQEEGGRAGFAPFNVQNVGGNVVVSYAKQDVTGLNELDGAGLGFVNIYNPEGRLLQRLQRGSYFNAPWGITLASSDFGAYSHDLLIGQFGSGEILAFDPLSGKYLGTLKDANNVPLKIQGLWGLSFGNGAGSGPATSLYFAAGINGEQGGLLGSIAAIERIPRVTISRESQVAVQGGKRFGASPLFAASLWPDAEMLWWSVRPG